MKKRVPFYQMSAEENYLQNKRLKVESISSYDAPE